MPIVGADDRGDPQGDLRSIEEFDPRTYLKPAREAMKEMIAQRMTEFGQAVHAGDYQPIPLAEVAK